MQRARFRNKSEQQTGVQETGRRLLKPASASCNSRAATPRGAIMALINFATVFRSQHHNFVTYLPLALVGLLALVGQGLCHDRLPNRPQSRRQPPAIYSYSTDQRERDFEALASHRLNRPYSWNNERLAKQLFRLEDEAAEVSEEVTNLVRDDEGTERRRGQQMGDSARLDSHANLAATSNRWPTKGRDQHQTRTKPTSVEANRHGTKGRVGGTKSIGSKAPASPANRRQFTEPRTPSVLESEQSAGAPNATASGGTSLKRDPQPKRKNLVCYYGTWAVYRPDAGRFAVENIDPFLCTHVIYGFTGLSYDSLIKPLDPWNDLEDNYGKGAMKRFTNLKRINPDLKTLVAIGGWNEGSVKYSKMASEPEARSRFVASVISFLEKYNFDGLDLDWEYPGTRGGASYDKRNFVTLLRQLSEAFKPRNYLLTAAVSAGKSTIDAAYDIPEVSKYLDLINLMAYDYHGGWETKTGMNAPLFASQKHDLSAEERTLNVNWSVNYWLAQGAGREKIMLGVGSYGRSFTLDKGQVNGLNAPASQKGRAGPYTREPGSLGYNEICESLRAAPQSWSVVRDPDYLAPYAYNTNERQWVGYDDRQSLALKTQFAKSMGLGGMMMWSIETDDFQGRCHNGQKFPLLNTIRRLLDDGQPEVDGDDHDHGSNSSSTTTSRPTVAPVSPGSTTSTRRPGEQEDQQPNSTTRRPLISTTSTSRPPQPDQPRPSSSTRRPTTRPRPTTSTTTSATTSTTSTTRRPPLTPQAEFECQADGMFADPRNCRKFYRCVGGAALARFQKYHFDCAPGTAFNEQAQYCDHVYNVPTCNRLKRESLLERTNINNTPAKHLITSAANDNELGAGANYNNRALARLYYPGYFSHHFQVHHRW